MIFKDEGRTRKKDSERKREKETNNFASFFIKIKYIFLF